MFDVGMSQYELWSRNSIDVDSLDEALTRLQLFNGEREFAAMLEAQVKNCDAFYLSMIKERIAANTALNLAELTETVPLKLTEDIIRLDEFGNNNVMHLVNALKQHDEESSFALMPSYQWKVHRNDFCSPDALQPLLLQLSSQYQLLRLKQKKAQEAAPDQERKSITFWVRSQDVVKVMCDIVKQIPISDPQGRFSQKTSTVYYDDSRLSLYAQSLVKLENSALIRFRWFGELTKDSEVCVERKINSQWVPDQRANAGFSLREEQVLGFVNGTYQPTGDFLAKHPTFVEVQQMIINDGLLPCLQTRYNRVAFQKECDDGVKVCLDTNVLMLREAKVDTDNDWHKRDNSYLEEDVHRFPFSVLEVKLHEHLLNSPPLWLEQLMRSGLLIRVDKFSKYLHGIAVVYHNSVKALPYWLDENFGRQLQEGRGEVDGDILLAEPRSSQVLSTSSPMKQTGRGGKAGANQSIYTQATNTLTRPEVAQLRNLKPAEEVRKGPTMKERCKKLCGVLNVFAYCGKEKGRMRVEPKTFFANERTYLQWYNAAVYLGSISIGYVLTENDPISLLIGRVLLILTAIISLYALVVFHWRTEMLMRRVSSASFADRFGPTTLGILFIAALIMTLVLSAMYPPVSSSSSSSPVAADGRVLSRYESLASHCAVPVELWSPPESKFRPTSLTYSLGELYIAEEGGRIGALDPQTLAYKSYNKLGLPPVGPTPLGAIAFLPSNSSAAPASFLYATRASPPSILEINTSSWIVVRAVSLKVAVDSLAIVPSNNAEGYLVYAAGKDLALWSMVYPFRTSSSSQNVSGVKPVGNVTGSSSSSSEAPILSYFQEQLFVYHDDIVTVNAVAADGSLSALRGYALAVPDARGLAFVPAAPGSPWTKAYVSTEGGKILSFRYNAQSGFEFCEYREAAPAKPLSFAAKTNKI